MRFSCSSILAVLYSVACFHPQDGCSITTTFVRPQEQAFTVSPHEGETISKKKSVLIVGWHPDAVDYSKRPGPTTEILRAALEGDRAKLEALGYDAELGFIRSAETAVESLRSLLAAKERACVLIGAGVRTIPEYLTLFEALVNTFHECAPGAKLCFNSGPFDSLDAVQRWLKPGDLGT